MSGVQQYANSRTQQLIKLCQLRREHVINDRARVCINIGSRRSNGRDNKLGTQHRRDGHGLRPGQHRGNIKGTGGPREVQQRKDRGGEA
eukprot:16450488-Heterocapsa_arctica.AAC.1